MFDFIFDGFQAFNALGLLFGGVVMTLLGGGLLAWWVSWRVRGRRVRGKIVAVKAQGERRTAEDWEEIYSKSIKEEEQSRKAAQESPGFFASFLPEFKKKPVATVFAYFFVMVIAMVPIAFFLFGSYTAYDYLSLKAGGVQTQARVVDIEESYDSDSGTTYAPVVVFTDTHGGAHRYKDRVSTGSNNYRRGQSVSVYYDPAKPKRFVIDSFWRYMGLALAFMAIGGGIIGWVLFHTWMKATGRELKPRPVKKDRKLAALKRAYYTGQRYFPVYEFQIPGGQVVQVDGRDDTNNWLGDKSPGKTVPLMVVPGKNGKPPKVKKPGVALLFFGLICLLPGLLLMKLALGQMKMNAAFFIVIAAGLSYFAFKVKGIIKPRHEWPGKEEFQAMRKEFTVSNPEVQSYELEPAEVREQVRLLDRNALIAVPIVLLLSVGMMFGGYMLFKDMNDLSGKALIAQGEIVGSQTRTDSDGTYMYYPVVRYTPLGGQATEFQGKSGSNPPLFQTGDKVMVLYDPDKPKRAMVDHGVLNWLPSLGLLLAGLLGVVYSLRLFGGIMARRRRV